MSGVYNQGIDEVNKLMVWVLVKYSLDLAAFDPGRQAKKLGIAQRADPIKVGLIAKSG